MRLPRLPEGLAPPRQKRSVKRSAQGILGFHERVAWCKGFWDPVRNATQCKGFWEFCEEGYSIQYVPGFCDATSAMNSGIPRGALPRARNCVASEGTDNWAFNRGELIEKKVCKGVCVKDSTGK